VTGASRAFDPLGLRRSLATVRSVVQVQGRGGDRTARRLDRQASVADLRRAARRRLPRGVFDYIDGGAEDEAAMGRNRAAFDRTLLSPRVLVGNDVPTIATSVLGGPAAYPLVLAPTGFTRIADPQGELAVARAAARAGLPYTLSTLSTRSIEEVRAVSDGRLWFQAYVWRDRGLVGEMLERARAARYEALVVTVDTAVFGRRERDVRRGFSLPPTIGPGTFVDGLAHPAWTWSFVRSEPIRFANVVGRTVGDGAAPVELSAYVNQQMDPTLSWDDVAWLRSRWDGPVVLKGVQRVADVVRAADEGIDAVVLSNHGGRQLDVGPAPLDLVAPAVDAGGSRLEVLVDGGVRRGSDIVKARAAGATAVLAGRAYLYALAAFGEPGVDRLLRWFGDDVRRTLALVGAPSVDDLDRSYLAAPPPGDPAPTNGGP